MPRSVSVNWAEKQALVEKLRQQGLDWSDIGERFGLDGIAMRNHYRDIRRYQARMEKKGKVTNACN